MGFPGSSVVKNSPANAGTTEYIGLIPGSERPPRGGHGNPLQYSCLVNPMDCSLLGSSVHGDSPGKDTRVVCHAFLQGIFPTQGLNHCLLQLPHWQADSLPLSYLGSPFMVRVLIKGPWPCLPPESLGNMDIWAV